VSLFAPASDWICDGILAAGLLVILRKLFGF
jgi:hypothetical protein